jgi:uncharacterized iron-regulated membrane protein
MGMSTLPRLSDGSAAAASGASTEDPGATPSNGFSSYLPPIHPGNFLQNDNNRIAFLALCKRIARMILSANALFLLKRRNSASLNSFKRQRKPLKKTEKRTKMSF